MKPAFYLIGKKDEMWSGPSMGVLIYEDKIEREMMDLIANNLHQGWQFFIKPQGWEEFILDSYRFGERSQSPLKLRQILAELLYNQGYIRDSDEAFYFIEQKHKYKYRREESLKTTMISLLLDHSGEPQEQMFRDDDKPVFDDYHMAYSLWKRGKLTFDHNESKQVSFLQDRNTKYTLQEWGGNLWLRSHMSWEILLDGLIKD